MPAMAGGTSLPRRRFAGGSCAPVSGAPVSPSWPSLPSSAGAGSADASGCRALNKRKAACVLFAGGPAAYAKRLMTCSKGQDRDTRSSPSASPGRASSRRPRSHPVVILNSRIWAVGTPSASEGLSVCPQRWHMWYECWPCALRRKHDIVRVPPVARLAEPPCPLRATCLGFEEGTPPLLLPERHQAALLQDPKVALRLALRLGVPPSRLGGLCGHIRGHHLGERLPILRPSKS